RSYGQGRAVQGPTLSELPQVLLADLFLPSSEAPDETVLPIQHGLYVVECHICMFFQLIIKTVCSHCGEIFLDSKCQSKQCREDVHPVLVVKAIVLVDDGSNQATVSFHDAILVARLLTLTEKQWNDISEGLSDCGRLVITKDGTDSRLPIAKLLNCLCSSLLVLRPCKLAVVRDKKSPTQNLINKKAMDEFQIRQVKIAKTSVQTWSLPLLSLACFALEEVN
ncbi:hypothetical protein EGW08_010791, partial [Elysia chlorotica]